MNKHYDTRSEERKRKQRLKVLERLFDGYGDQDATLDATAVDKLTSDDGTIDTTALKQVVAQAEQNQDDSPADDKEPADLDRTEQNEAKQQDNTQSTLGYFNSAPALTQPAMLPVVAGTKASVWLPDRLRRELESMAGNTPESLQPGCGRAVKGMSAYAVYVCLVALNLSLVGLLPV